MDSTGILLKATEPFKFDLCIDFFLFLFLHPSCVVRLNPLGPAEGNK